MCFIMLWPMAEMQFVPQSMSFSSAVWFWFLLCSGPEESPDSPDAIPSMMGQGSSPQANIPSPEADVSRTRRAVSLASLQQPAANALPAGGLHQASYRTENPDLQEALLGDGLSESMAAAPQGEGYLQSLAPILEGAVTRPEQDAGQGLGGQPVAQQPWFPPAGNRNEESSESFRMSHEAWGSR